MGERVLAGNAFDDTARGPTSLPDPRQGSFDFKPYDAYTPEHSDVARNHVNAFLRHFSADGPAPGADSAVARNVSDLLLGPTSGRGRDLLDKFRARGLPTDLDPADLRRRAEGTAQVIKREDERLQRSGRRATNPEQRRYVARNATGRNDTLAIGGVAAGAGAASHSREEPSHHSQVQPRTKGGQFDGPPNWD